MKVAIVGATGALGRRILDEAVTRGHDVTAIARDPSRLDGARRARSVALNATDPMAVEEAVQGHDAVISAVGPSNGAPPSIVVDVTRALAGGCTRAGVRRVLVVNGAGSLAVEPGVELLSTPDFPKGWRPIALAHREALEIWRRVKELDWTVVSPAAQVEPAERRGSYRVGHNELLVDASGRSYISAEDFAMGIVDELERGAHVRERITLAY